MEECNQKIIADTQMSLCTKENGNDNKCNTSNNYSTENLRDELLKDIEPMLSRMKLFLKNNLKSQNTKNKKLRDTLQTVQSKIITLEEQIKK